MAVVAVAVVKLYSGSSGEIQLSPSAQTGALTGSRILSAVPADAVLILHSRQLRNTIKLINDRTNVAGEIVAGRGGLSKFFEILNDTSLRSLENADNSISLHYSGSLVPLLIVNIGNSTDTTGALGVLLSAAKDASLKTKVLDCRKLKPSSALLLVSPSETVITSSQRHIESGTSIYDREYFSDIAPLPTGRIGLYIANDQTNRLLGSYMTKRASSQSPFFSNLSSWTALSIDSFSDEGVSMQGWLMADDDPTNFINVFRKSPTAEVQALSMLPVSTVFAFGLASSKVDVYIDNYSRFLDAVHHLDDYKAKDAAFRSRHRMGSKQWASKLRIREVVKARFLGSEGAGEVLLLRIGKEDPEILLKETGLETIKALGDTICSYPYQGATGLLFGKGLSLEKEECMSYINGWLVVGEKASVQEYVKGDIIRRDLKTMLGSTALKDLNCFCYFSVTEEASALEEYFKPEMVETIRNGADGIAYEPVFLTIGSMGTKINLSVSRRAVIDDPEIALSKAKLDTSIVIPTGPFKVYNCGTNTDNLLIQNPNLTISLSETSGKGIWTIPFKEPICGRVENVDFYKNDKIQFLFAAGSKLYLVDRLGRYVSDFPRDLGKEVRLGPDVYDFSNSRDYSVVVLHKDNSIELYDLAKGNKPAQWKGIKAPEPIKELPELIETGGKKYWIVRTGVQLRVYGFDGGEPLVEGKEGKSAVRPDSPLEISDGSLIAICADGKRRQFKLE